MYRSYGLINVFNHQNLHLFNNLSEIPLSKATQTVNQKIKSGNFDFLFLKIKPNKANVKVFRWALR